MNEIFLYGANDISEAGNKMQAAASQIADSAEKISSIVWTQNTFWTGWIERFEQAVKDNNFADKTARTGPPTNEDITEMLREELARVHQKDRIKTLEINLLTKENRVLHEQLNEAITSTHRQAHCINKCAAHIGPETSATIEGLPLAVKALVYQLEEFQNHENQTHESMEAIFGNTSSFQDLAKQMKEKYGELREFVRLATLQLQKPLTDGAQTELFQFAYRMYAKHNVEKPL